MSLLPVLLMPVMGLGPSAQEDVDGPRPNVVLIMLDDVGWNDLGFTGNAHHRTPNIDRLAGDGVVFSTTYANAPNCAPSRACLMTGQYSPRHGVYTVGTSKRGRSHNRRIIPVENRRSLEPSTAQLPIMLRDAGYRTVHVGKWHLGDDPLEQGFQVNIGGNKAGHPKSYFSPYTNGNLTDGTDGEYLTDRLTTEAIRSISEGDGPVLLYLSFYSAHTPLQPRNDILESVTKVRSDASPVHAKYQAMIECIDQNVGRVLDALEEQDALDDTIIILTSDNGALGATSSLDPMAGSKGMLYEGGIRVPMFVYWKDRINGSRTVDEPVMHLDLVPTIAELCRIDVESRSLDGRSLAPLLGSKQELGERELHWHFPAYLEASAKKGTWRATPCGVIRKGRYKLIESFEDGSMQLFDLQVDPGEQRNLAGTMPEVRQDLLDRMNRWRDRVGAEVPRQPNPEYVDPNAGAKESID